MPRTLSPNRSKFPFRRGERQDTTLSRPSPSTEADVGGLLHIEKVCVDLPVSATGKWSRLLARATYLPMSSAIESSLARSPLLIVGAWDTARLFAMAIAHPMITANEDAWEARWSHCRLN